MVINELQNALCEIYSQVFYLDYHFYSSYLHSIMVLESIIRLVVSYTGQFLKYRYRHTHIDKLLRCEVEEECESIVLSLGVCGTFTLDSTLVWDRSNILLCKVFKIYNCIHITKSKEPFYQIANPTFYRKHTIALFRCFTK